MAMATLTEREGYVIRAANFRDSDQMISALTSDGLISFLARRVNKPTSKNGPACRLLAHSKFSLSEGKAGGFSLRESLCLAPAPEKEDLLTMASLTFIAELSSKTLQGEGLGKEYPWLARAVEAIREGFDPLTSVLVLFAHYLALEGFGLNVDECVYCGAKTGIVGLSYQDGGFVCRKCLNESATEANSRKLKIIRYCFRCGLSDFSRVTFQKEECIGLISELCQYLNDLTGVRLKSLSIIQKL